MPNQEDAMTPIKEIIVTQVVPDADFSTNGSGFVKDIDVAETSGAGGEP
jgi:hypothetical protein